MVFRDICRVYRAYSSPRFPLAVTIASGDAFKNGPALSWIISTSLGTSWRRQCGGFIHRSVYFRFVLPPSPLVFSLSPRCVLFYPRASLVAALTHHLLYIALVETPDIIFDILFCCRRSSHREATEEKERGKKKKRVNTRRIVIRDGLKIDGEVRYRGKARDVITDEIDGFANRPLVIPELTTRMRDDVNVCCPRARAPIFRRPDQQLYGHRQGRALRNAIIDAGVSQLRCCCSPVAGSSAFFV